MGSTFLRSRAARLACRRTALIIMAAAPEPEPELPGEDFDFMKTAFPIEEVRSLVKGGKVLVIGCGGGCDIVFATAVATYLRDGDSDTLFYTANTKGGLPTDKDVLTEVEGCSNILRPPAEVIPVDVNGPPTYGSTAVEQSMPRFADGSPYLVCLPSKSKDVEQCTRENKELMVPQIRALGFDAIVGCDAGGDGLTGGMALEEGDVGLGRDVQMIGVLKACGLPFIQLVFGPGCDGESEEGAMRAALYKEQQAGTLRVKSDTRLHAP